MGFKKWVENIAVESMRSTIAATFYACDYATKPNMVCAPLLVAMRDGVARYDQQIKEEEEKRRGEEMEMADGQGALACENGRQRSKKELEMEAGKRLIRMHTAAQNAQVKGNCLMAMQMLTRREVIRSHFTWQLMMKHPIWMAFEHRRSKSGYSSLSSEGRTAVTAMEATLAQYSSDDSSGLEDEDSADDIGTLGKDQLPLEANAIKAEEPCEFKAFDFDK